MSDLAKIIGDNAKNIGEFAAKIVEAAAKTIEFIAAHKDAIIEVGKWAGATLIIGKVLITLGNLALAIKTLSPALNAVPWAQFGNNAVAALQKPIPVAGSLGKALGMIGAAVAGWEIGTAFGNWLNQFDIVQKAGLSWAHTLTMSWLGLKKTWYELPFIGDKEKSAQVSREMDVAWQAYNEGLADINKNHENSAAMRMQKEKDVQTQIAKTTNMADQAANKPSSNPNIVEFGGRQYDTSKLSDAGYLKRDQEEAKAEAEANAPEKQEEEAPWWEKEGLPAGASTREGDWYKREKSKEDAEAVLAGKQKSADEQEADKATEEKAKAEDERQQKLKEEYIKSVEKRKQEEAKAEEKANQEAERQREKARQYIDDQWQIKKREIEAKRAAEEEKTRVETEKRRERSPHDHGGGEQYSDEEVAAYQKEYDKHVKPIQQVRGETGDQAMQRMAQASDRLGSLKDFAEKMRAKKAKDEAETKAAEEARAKNKAAAEKMQGEQEKARDQFLTDSKHKSDAFRQVVEQAAADQKKALEDTAAEQKKLADEKAEAEKAAADKAKSAWQSYADRVKQLSQEMADRKRKEQDELIGLDPKASEETKWKARAQAARDYEAAANKALKAGDKQGALKLSDQAADAFRGLANAPAALLAKGKQSAFDGVRQMNDLAASINAQVMNAMEQGGMKVFGGQAAEQAKTPSRVVELRFGVHSLQGDEAAAEALLKQLELAGMRA